jgi:hypothetical protein
LQIATCEAFQNVSLLHLIALIQQEVLFFYVCRLIAVGLLAVPVCKARRQTLESLEVVSDLFVELFVLIAITSLSMWAGKLCIKKVLLSNCLAELMELHQVLSLFYQLFQILLLQLQRNFQEESFGCSVDGLINGDVWASLVACASYALYEGSGFDGRKASLRD